MAQNPDSDGEREHGVPQPVQTGRGWIACAGLLALAVLVRCLPPSITFEDSGEFATAAALPGIAHPSGYPLHTVLAYLVTWLPFGEPAWRVNLFSALCGAGTAALLCAVLLRLRAGGPAALSAALLATLGDTVWSQSLVAEVYALNALAMVALLLLLLRWEEHPTPRRLMVLALVFGLGVGNHHILVLYGPLLAIYAWRRKPGVLWEPSSLVALLGGALCGLSIYLYLPLRSAMDPLLDWGNPETWDNFWTVVSREQFAGVDVVEGVTIAERLGHLRVFGQRLLWQEFGPLAAPFALLGFVQLWKRRRGLSVLTLAMFLAGSLGLVYLLAFHFNPSRAFVFRVYYINSYVIFGLFAGVGMGALWNSARVRSQSVLRITVGLLLLSTPALALIRNYSDNDLSGDRLAALHAEAILQTLEPNAVLMDVSRDVNIMPLIYARLIDDTRPDVKVFGRYGLVFNRWDEEPLLDRVMTTTSELHAWRRQILRRARAEGRAIYYMFSPIPADTALEGGEPVPVEQVGLLYREQRAGQVPPPAIDFEQAYGPILKLEPKDVPNYMARSVPGVYHLRHGQALARSGDESGAVAAFERAMAFAANQLEMAVLCNRTFNRAGRFELGRRAFNISMAQHAPSERASLKADHHYSRIEYLDSTRDFDGVQAELRQVLEFDPYNSIARERMGIFLYNRGRELAKSGDFAAALLLHEESRNFGFDAVRVGTQLAICHFETGNQALALEQLETLHRTQPGDLGVMQNLALVSLRMGNSERGTVILRKMLALDPSNEFATLNLRGR